MKQRLSLLLAALWWGSLTGLGFVVVPMLFAHLGSAAAAGAMAATVAWLASRAKAARCSGVICPVRLRTSTGLFRPDI